MSHYSYSQPARSGLVSTFVLFSLTLCPTVTMAATFTVGGTDTPGFGTILPRDFSVSDNLSISNLVSQLIVTEQQLTALNETYFATGELVKPSPNNSSISLQSVISSFGRLKLDARANTKQVNNVPVLPQTESSDLYQGIYDFGNTTSQDLSQPLNSGIVAPLPASYKVSKPKTAETRTTGVVRPSLETIESLSLPNFGGPLRVIASPSISGPNAVRQVSLPSVRTTQTPNWGESEVNVFFASLPKDEIGDIDIFLRTAYRTSPSEILKRLENSLKLEVKTKFRLMPDDVFANPRQPLSNNWRDRL